MKSRHWIASVVTLSVIAIAYALGQNAGYAKGWQQATYCYETEERIMHNAESPDASCYADADHDRR